MTSKEEINYWYEEAKKFQKSYESVLEELNEFQLNSHELEAELETQLNQSEIKLRDLKVYCSKQQNELENIKDKYNSLQQSSYHQMSDLETKLKTLENYKETSRKYIRQLEQTNDDLERANRAALASLEDCEHKLNQAIEHNVFLETDIEEREAMHFADMQHLMEEIRDLKHELIVRNNSEVKTASGETSIHSDDMKLSARDILDRKRGSQTSQEQGNLVRKCSAMTIISEMIKQIGFMEKKLSSFQPSDKADLLKAF